MTARDYLESGASLLLMLAVIMLCLLLAVYDRTAALIVGHRDGVEPSGARPPVSAPGGR